MISSVISFCTNDFRFLKACVEGVAPFSEEIFITVCDHFFDGSEENYALLEEVYRSFPQCTFLLFTFDPQQTHRPFSPLFPDHPDWRHEWHNTGRVLSYFYASPKTEYLLFVDCDEILDGGRFMQWLQAEKREEIVYRFSSFWHFREAKFEADFQADLCLLVKKSAVSPNILWDEDEREGVCKQLCGTKAKKICGIDGVPMTRHYTGVRTKEEMLKKCATWGHHWERDWESLIREDYSKEFSGKDFIRGYTYQEKQPIFDPLAEVVPELPRMSLEEHIKNLNRFPNVIMVSQKVSFKWHLEHEFAYRDSH
ncbi:MAG: hypothetical protein HYX67_16345 [Candidatus Melainabacteria bacterium]|nr:hypothetical protein [Candidatus Melainabacteria bacterium]